MRPLVWCQAWLGGPPDTRECPPSPKKITHVHENTYVEHEAKIRKKQNKNFLIETIGPTCKKTKEVYVS